MLARLWLYKHVITAYFYLSMRPAYLPLTINEHQKSTSVFSIIDLIYKAATRSLTVHLCKLWRSMDRGQSHVSGCMQLQFGDTKNDSKLCKSRQHNTAEAVTTKWK